MTEHAQPASHSVDVDPRYRRWLGRFHVLGEFWHHLHHFGARHRLLFRPVTAFWVLFFFLALRQYRRALAANLAVVMGPASWWTGRMRALRTFWNWACCRNERYERLQRKKTQVDLTVEGEEHWHRVFDSGKGFILLTAHLGSYESGLMVPGGAVQRTLHMVRAAELDEASQRFVEKTVEKYAEDHVEHHFLRADDFRGGLALRDALSAGEIVAMPGDRPMGDGKTVATSMFARPMDLPVGPFVLARTASAPMLSVFLLREGKRRYRMIFRTPIEITRTGNRVADLEAAAQRFAEDMEWAIREAPTQWFCFRDIWGKS